MHFVRVREETHVRTCALLPALAHAGKVECSFMKVNVHVFFLLLHVYDTLKDKVSYSIG